MLLFFAPIVLIKIYHSYIYKSFLIIIYYTQIVVCKKHKISKKVVNMNNSIEIITSWVSIVKY